MFRLSKFPPAALSSIAVATATTHSSALQAENLSYAKHIVNSCGSHWKGSELNIALRYKKSNIFLQFFLHLEV